MKKNIKYIIAGVTCAAFVSGILLYQNYTAYMGNSVSTFTAGTQAVSLGSEITAKVNETKNSNMNKIKQDALDEVLPQVEALFDKDYTSGDTFSFQEFMDYYKKTSDNFEALHQAYLDRYNGATSGTEVYEIFEENKKEVETFQQEADAELQALYVNDDWHYTSKTLKISVEAKNNGHANYWVCDVQTLYANSICSALSDDTFGGERTTTSDETAAHNGILGINGSGFSYANGEPSPVNISIKNGTIYRDGYTNTRTMCVMDDGTLFTAPENMSASDLLEIGVINTFAFGPNLLIDGEDATDWDNAPKTDSVYQYPRTSIGMLEPLHYIVIVADGKTAESQGLTCQELVQMYKELGCTYAYNLDGGGSTTLYFDGRVVNNPSDSSGERACSDVLYFSD